MRESVQNFDHGIDGILAPEGDHDIVSCCSDNRLMISDFLVDMSGSNEVLGVSVVHIDCKERVVAILSHLACDLGLELTHIVVFEADALRDFGVIEHNHYRTG